MLCEWGEDGKCERCGRKRPSSSKKVIANCAGHGKQWDEAPAWLTCPHRGDAIATINGRDAGCGCGETDVFACHRFDEPTLKNRGGNWCIERVQRRVPQYTGRQCRGCDANEIRAAEPVQRDSSRLGVGILSPTLLFGGAERWVASLASGLDSPQIQVTGVAIRDAGRVFPPVAKRLRVPIFQGPDTFRALASQSDVLIVWGLTDLSTLAGFRGRVVMVSHGHCDWTIRAIEKCMPYVTDWAAVSRHAATAFPDPSKTTVLHNGIDVDRCVLGRPRNVVRNAWGLRPDEIAVGYVGRLSGEKRPLGAVEAAAKLGRPYRAVLVGGGPNTYTFLREAQQLLPDVVYQPTLEDVGEVYRALDAFVLVSPAEGFSLALAEAWLCQCPTVSTPVGATEVMERHGNMGVLVPVGATADVLAGAVQKAVRPSNQATVLHASRVVAEHYTAEAMCRRWKEYLLSLVAR